MQNFNTKDYGKFAVALSLLAIILTQTQFRPFYTYFDTPKIVNSVNQHLSISHNFGHLTFQHYIQTKNVGKAPATLSRIYYYLKKINDNSFRRLLSAKTSITYTGNKETPSIQYPILDTYILPNNLSQGDIMIYETLSDNDNREIELLRRQIEKDIRDKKDSNQNAKAIINYALSDKVSKLISTNLQGFSIGEYNLFIVSLDENKKLINPEQYYSFNVFESDIEKMQEITNDYQTGGNGIYYYKNTLFGFVATLYAKNDDKTIKTLLEESAELIKKNTYQ